MNASKIIGALPLALLLAAPAALAQFNGGGGGGGGAAPGGSSGDIQTNNGSGGFGHITPGSGVSLGTAANSNGGMALQSGAITAGDVLIGASGGVSDSMLGTGQVTNTAGSQPTGGSFNFHVGYISNNWYLATVSPGALSSSTAQSNSVLYCTPFVVPAGGVEIKSLGYYVGTLDASAVVVSAIYASSASSGRPGNLVDYAPASGTYMVPSGTGIVYAAVANTTDILKAGAYWSCTATNSSSTVKLYSVGLSSTSVGLQMGATTGNIVHIYAGSNAESAVYCSLGTGSCAPAFTGTLTTASMAWPNSLSGASWSDLTASATAPAAAFQVY